MSKAQWTIDAQRDLARIDAYLRELDGRYARNVGVLAVRAGRFLARMPAAGPALDARTRKWRIAGTPYLLIYRIVPAGVEILRLRHSAEDWRPE